MPSSGRSGRGGDVCIDIEATMCLVMRVEHDGSRVVGMSDGELVAREAVHVNTSCNLLRGGIVPASSHDCN